MADKLHSVRAVKDDITVGNWAEEETRNKNKRKGQGCGRVYIEDRCIAELRESKNWGIVIHKLSFASVNLFQICFILGRF